MIREHFAVIVDRGFAPQAIAMQRSLARVFPEAKLWILPMDSHAEKIFRRRSESNLEVLHLSDLETAQLRNVRSERTLQEYCWTLKPVLIEHLLGREDRGQAIQRATYLDADLYFYASPRILFDEMDRIRKHVLITEHGFAPVYRYQASKYGRFCAQFVAFNSTPEGRQVLSWWRDRCLEWCFARREGGKSGDQRYLDHWPETYPETVHVFSSPLKTLGPWNLSHVVNQEKLGEAIWCHFHKFRIYRDSTQLWYGYRMSKRAACVFEDYANTLKPILAELEDSWPYPQRYAPEHGFLQNAKRRAIDFLYRCFRLEGKAETLV